MSRPVFRFPLAALCLWTFALALALAPGCDCGGGELMTGPKPCTSGAMCPSGSCVDGRCAPVPVGCVDRDNDGYGAGCPRGPDCDDTVRTQTGTEICDGNDNDCDGMVDEDVRTACGDCVACVTRAFCQLRNARIGVKRYCESCRQENPVAAEGMAVNEALFQALVCMIVPA